VSYDLHGEIDGPPLSTAELERVAEAIVAIDPAAERFDGDGFVEFDTAAMQVWLSSTEATITVPYWYTGDEADTVMRRAHEYAAALTDTGGFVMWDPQVEAVAGTDAYDDARAVRKLGATSARVRATGGNPVVEWAFSVVLATAIVFLIYGLIQGFSGQTALKALVWGVIFATVVVVGAYRRGA